MIADGHCKIGTPSGGPHFDEDLDDDVMSQRDSSEILAHSLSRIHAAYSLFSSDDPCEKSRANEVGSPRYAISYS